MGTGIGICVQNLIYGGIGNRQRQVDRKEEVNRR